jgi:adenylate kinase
MRLILLGPPGSGKGTQAKRLGERLGLTHISTGDIFREAKRGNTPTGKLVAPYLDSGRLVPDDLTNEVIAELFRGEKRPDCFVMDGYPRTLAQAHAFDVVLHQQCLDVTSAVLISVEDEQIVERLGGRWACPNCKRTYHLKYAPPAKPGICDDDGTTLIQREDDREETVRKRLGDYHHYVDQLVEYYRAKGLLREVYGEGALEAVYQRILDSLS